MRRTNLGNMGSCCWGGNRPRDEGLRARASYYATGISSLSNPFTLLGISPGYTSLNQLPPPKRTKPLSGMDASGQTDGQAERAKGAEQSRGPHGRMRRPCSRPTRLNDYDGKARPRPACCSSRLTEKYLPDCVVPPPKQPVWMTLVARRVCFA